MTLTLDDQREIEQLLVRYTWWIDGYATDKDFYAIFTDDAVLISPFSGTFSGKRGLDAFVEYRSRTPSWGPRRTEQLRHIISNVLVEGDGRVATVRAFLLDFKTNLGGESGNSALLCVGHYHCEAVRVGNVWKLRRRLLVVDNVTGGPHDNSARSFEEVTAVQLKQAAASA
ncbi:nuclear transport factor 2 family protein [Burkholderia sp. Ax-1719]|uniref:nuclear transport factor 2 family protein n=1 Tax=Burkholderia sp. Ax-1719 TaxID=2608334 RepID=UPI00141E5E56|nr:nuclear transport factor 2 family protein [Burkholderia sp. Ax-1719]NIE66881.1 nuclear transport factor 2 family protein [Burkholderia sp. Ax-1719]